MEDSEQSNSHSTSQTQTKRTAAGSRTEHVVPTILDSDGIRLLPSKFEFCQIDDIVALIAQMLHRLIQHNDGIALTPISLTRFHSRAPPGISVVDYLSRITKFTNVEPCCLLILLHYVDRVSEKLPNFTITSLTVHRFVIAAVAAGSKALCDSFCTNGRYAKVGGVNLAEMNVLEKELLQILDWRLTTSGALLARYYESLVATHPNYRLSTAPLPDIRSSTEPDTLRIQPTTNPSDQPLASLDLPHSHPKALQTETSFASPSKQIQTPLSATATAPGSPNSPLQKMADV